MKNLLEKTAWSMVPPVPYSVFHILFIAIGLGVVAILSYYTTKKVKKTNLSRVLFFCGVFLAFAECWKQLFLYYVVNQEIYDWWYFPFQLCSLPMYFCLILPFVSSKKAFIILYTFMQDFNLLGGIMALAEPSGLFHPYLLLTLHGLIWHLLLIYIGLVIAFSQLSDTSFRGFIRTLPLFFVCCIIATIINASVKPLGQANMFYISPYYPSAQIVFHQIAMRFGIPAGNAVYLFATCLGGLLFHTIFGQFHLHSPRKNFKRSGNNIHQS